MEVEYYTCLNESCARYRGVFIEGDPEHLNCERTSLSLEGERQPKGWMAVAAPVAIAAGIAAAATFAVRKLRGR